MGIVLKAFDPSLHRMAAIKVLAPQLATSAAARTTVSSGKDPRRHHRPRGTRRVSTSWIEVNGLPYLVMEYIARRIAARSARSLRAAGS